ncbi:phytanoyl-CoA dioxygenase family protein [Desertimonas flava]|uniref:phytanoyl-CoA dioxygenase family protein n=1 Tax=Desertimonas flava TaxID=2064846 RepID=UPI0013C4C41C|nr:phytanoyl-CoA dioxygenase family protein [Desertimonas flava]
MTAERAGNPAGQLADDLARYERDGFVVIPGAVTDAELDTIRAELEPHLDESRLLGRNDFEGFRTNRVYALLAKAPSVATLVEHERVVAMLDRLLMPNYLLSANLAINLWPGETAQQLHFDDSFYPLPRPRPAISVSAIWAIDDFTEENGATEVIAGSHRWGDEVPGPDTATTPVVMTAGSVVVFSGTLWHRGGANRSARPRLAITPQYCEPWARQQEQHVLATGDGAAAFSPRLQAMLGYSIHPPFMGHVNGLHPRRLIDDAYDPAASGAGEAATARYAEMRGGR